MSGYHSSSEPIRFERDCAAIMVPQGQEVTLPAGQTGYITQALGGSFTVFVDGNLFRISGADADALGKEAPDPLVLPEGAGDADVEKLVWQQLRTCYDPEIPVNIVDLGLIYDCSLEKDTTGGRLVRARALADDADDPARLARRRDDVDALDGGGALVRSGERGEDLDGGGLAGAVGADEGEDAAPPHAEREAVQGPDACFP